MMQDRYIPGVACWVDTNSTEFYRGLFGWERRRIGRGRRCGGGCGGCRCRPIRGRPDRDGDGAAFGQVLGASVGLGAEGGHVDEHRLVFWSLTARRSWQTLRSSSSCFRTGSAVRSPSATKPLAPPPLAHRRVLTLDARPGPGLA